MDFEPIRGLGVSGYRLASVEVINGPLTSGDAVLLRPDGAQIDLYWRSEQTRTSAAWSPPPSARGTGVIHVGVTGIVARARDLGPVLEAAVRFVDTGP